MSSYTRQRRKPNPTHVAQDPYEAFLAFTKRERSHATWEHHRSILGKLQAAYPEPTLTPEQARDWLARPVVDRDGTQRPRAASTRRNETGTLKAFWNFLADTYGMTNIMAEVKMPPHPRRLRPKSVTRKQVNDLLDVLPGEPQRALVLLMSDAGLRVSEACAITPERVVLEGRRRYLRVLGKGDAERLVPIGGRLAAALAAQVERGRRADYGPKQPLVRTKTGRPYTRQLAWEMVAVAGLRAGIEDMHPHRLRHSWACWLHYERRVPLGMVSRLLGHASLSITQDYLGVREEELFDALDFLASDDSIAS